ncbi:MAG: arylsulfatase [Bacteroidales bacterium]
MASKLGIYTNLPVLASICVLFPSCKQENAGNRPNVIIVLTDDQGYGDISAHGNPVIYTPNLDKLHDESTRFTNFHVDPTSAPSRAALLTGKYARHVNVWHTIMGGNFLPEEEITLAEVFKSAGYNTAIFGKWHLGGSYPFRPIDQGFDTWIGQGNGGTGTTDDYWYNDRVNDMYLVKEEWQAISGYGPDIFLSKAHDFIKTRKKETPFFIYLSTYVPHNPLTLPDTTWVEKYRDKVAFKTAYYYASIERLDKNIGLLRETLEKEGIAENTILLFMTDNGGTYGIDVFNAGMRGGKGTIYEGGHRVPFYISWPGGGIKKGKDIDALTAHVDILPTLADLCNIDLDKTLNLDGFSLSEVLLEENHKLKDRALVVEVQRDMTPEKFNNSVVLKNNWRLINGHELYNLHADPGQLNDISEHYPDTVEALINIYNNYYTLVTNAIKHSKAPVVGSDHEKKTALTSADWTPLDERLTPWNQHHVSSGYKQEGYWDIRVEKEGSYSIEISRWPGEAGLAMNEAMAPRDTIDAFEMGKGRKYSIYNYHNEFYPALDISRVRLQIDNNLAVKEISPGDKNVVFNMNMNKGKHRIKADFLDQDGIVITGAYYLVISKE